MNNIKTWGERARGALLQVGFVVSLVGGVDDVDAFRSKGPVLILIEVGADLGDALKS